VHRVVSSDLVVWHAFIFRRVLFVEKLIGYNVLQWSEVLIATVCLCLSVLIEAGVLLRLCLYVLLSFILLLFVPFPLFCRLLMHVLGLQVRIAVILQLVVKLL
jgi:hypothetical protein